MPDQPLNLVFRVFGMPQPQGSSKAFVPKGWKRAVITSDNAKVKPWRQEISGAAMAAMTEDGQSLSEGPVSLTATFYFDRPKSLPKQRLHKTTKPDIDKLLRALLDSLTGIVFRDDAQVTSVTAFKKFGSPARVEVLVSSTDEQAQRRSA